jgi:hypothetical protein
MITAGEDHILRGINGCKTGDSPFFKIIILYEHLKKYKMKFYTITLLTIFIAFCACQQQPQSEIDNFETVFEITVYDSIYSDKNDIISSFSNIEIFNNILVTNNSNDDYYFSFYDLDKGVLLSKWGKIGQGPNEYIQLGVGFNVYNSQLVFMDFTKKEINSVPILNILNKEDAVPVRKESYPYTRDFRPNSLNIINDKKIMIGSFKEGRFGILDSANNIIDCLFDYPFKCEEITGIYRGSVFQSLLKSNAEQSKFVILTRASDIFEIYQIIDSEINRTCISSFKHSPKIKKKTGEFLNFAIDDNQSIGGFMDMAVSKDMICFTYSSKSLAESSDLDIESKEILCFDWNGEKLKKYILPFPIHQFCVDEKYIYGVREFVGETIIYRFRINN